MSYVSAKSPFYRCHESNIFVKFLVQLCIGRGHGSPRWQLESTDIPVEDLEPNPVVQGVKLIMVSAMLLSLSDYF